MEPQTSAGMVAAARARIQSLSVDEVAAELATGEIVLVDIRESEERATTGVIPGALHAARGMLEFYADPTSPYHRPEFETDRRIVLYCAFGGRSALATDMLQTLGYESVAHLDGGFKSWIARNQPAESV